jgi:predicted nucleic acid-binding protein
MRFWDSSALVPLFVDEPSTPAIKALLADDPGVIIWMFSGVEMLSAVARLGRSSEGLDDQLPAIRREILRQQPRWAAVTDADGVRRRAERLVGLHALASADAQQLAAALVAASDRPETLEFVTLDRPLARAAELEGFQVAVPLAPPSHGS